MALRQKSAVTQCAASQWPSYPNPTRTSRRHRYRFPRDRTRNQQQVVFVFADTQLKLEIKPRPRPISAPNSQPHWSTSFRISHRITDSIWSPVRSNKTSLAIQNNVSHMCLAAMITMVPAPLHIGIAIARVQQWSCWKIQWCPNRIRNLYHIRTKRLQQSNRPQQQFPTGGLAIWPFQTSYFDSAKRINGEPPFQNENPNMRQPTIHHLRCNDTHNTSKPLRRQRWLKMNFWAVKQPMNE
jgi:hypothetical protein